MNTVKNRGSLPWRPCSCGVFLFSQFDFNCFVRVFIPGSLRESELLTSWLDFLHLDSVEDLQWLQPPQQLNICRSLVGYLEISWDCDQSGILTAVIFLGHFLGLMICFFVVFSAVPSWWSHPGSCPSSLSPPAHQSQKCKFIFISLGINACEEPRLLALHTRASFCATNITVLTTTRTLHLFVCEGSTPASLWLFWNLCLLFTSGCFKTVHALQKLDFPSGLPSLYSSTYQIQENANVGRASAERGYRSVDAIQQPTNFSNSSSDSRW